VAAVHDVLGSDLVGAYLYGSAILGGLRPRSDVDVLVVARRPTAHEEKRRLVDPLLAISGRDSTEPARAVDLTILVESEIRPWRFPPAFDFQYGEWLRREFESGNVEPWPTRTRPDLASVITMVLLGNMPLLGPAPAEVFDPVPRDDLVRAIVGDIESLLGDLDFDTANVILTLARIWSTVATGAIRSKDAAADWALTRLAEEQRAVLARARAIYLGIEEDRWDDLQPRLRTHADSVVTEIERLAGGRSS
jgi:streptomycin 3"-adenylyltransferase